MFAGKAEARTFYISNDLGDDTRTSTQAQNSATPWKNHPDSNLATSNSATMKTNFVAGDTIILRKGETWWDTQLTSGKAGTGPADSQLITTKTEDGFGIGAKPIIAGAVLLNGTWTDTGVNGEYRIALTTQPFVVYNGDTELVSGTSGSLASNGFGWSSNFLYVKIGSDPTGGNIQAAQRYAVKSQNDYRKYENIDFRYSNNTTAGVFYSGAAVIGTVLNGNSFSRGETYGIRCYKCTSPIINNNTVTARPSDTTGTLIYISDGGSGGSIYGNTISGADVGIEPGTLMNVYLNNISNSLSSGIYYIGNNNSIYSNTISASSTGVNFNGNNNSIYSNTLSASSTGIYFNGSIRCTPCQDNNIG